jgi:hypothetical protein
MATGRPGSNVRNPQEGKKKTLLTHTGLLMEGTMSNWLRFVAVFVVSSVLGFQVGDTVRP